jgi:hypothetical protein
LIYRPLRASAEHGRVATAPHRTGHADITTAVPVSPTAYTPAMNQAEFTALREGEAVLWHEGAEPHALQPGVVLRRPLLQSRCSLVGIALVARGRIVYPTPAYVHRASPAPDPDPACPLCQPAIAAP